MHQHNLWAPWRISYIKGLAPGPAKASPGGGASPANDAASDTTAGVPQKSSGTQSRHAEDGCFLCDAVAAELTETQRAERMILCRDERGVLLLNRYPYTNGHLMVAPLDHVPDLEDMSGEQRAGLMDLAVLGQRLLKITMNPQGFNIGMNIGRCAGAGVPGHAHLHIVPRWHGDVNFMDTFANVRVIPQALAHSYEDLRAALATIESRSPGAG